MNTSSADIILIGCTKTKRSERSAARDLYDPSDLFRRRRAYAESTGKPWGIFSALHGFVDPDRHIDPYDTTIADRRTKNYGPIGPFAASVLSGCYKHLGIETELVEPVDLDRGRVGRRAYTAPITIEVHAGIDYVRALHTAFALGGFQHVTITHPVEGLQIGEQKAHYRRLAEPAPRVNLIAPASSWSQIELLPPAPRSEQMVLL